MLAWPLHVLMLVVAAGIGNAILLLFASFLVFQWGTLLTIIYGALIAVFAWVNLQVLHRVLAGKDVASGWCSRPHAHGLSLMLPLAYLLGALENGLMIQQSWPHLLAMLIPSLVNWQAIEQTRLFYRRRWLR